MTTLSRFVAGLALGGLTMLGACGDFDITNENAPTEDELTGNPTRPVLARAATGIMGTVFNDVAAEIQQFGLYGRELYNLLGNDPRETGEELRGPQDPGGRAGASWAGKYQHIRTINAYLRALDATTDLTPEEVSASRGFAQTFKALAFHRLIVRTGPLGIPIDVDRPLTDDPAPFVTEAAAYEYIVALFDTAAANLQAGGAAFPFTMAPGYEGFTTPASFLLVNRGLSGQAQIDQATLGACGQPCFQGALSAIESSFITTQGLPGTLDQGVYLAYDEAAGEPQNPITESLTQQRYYVHPSIQALVQTRPNGQPDLRWVQKTEPGTPKTLNNLTGTIKPVMYNDPAAGLAPDLGADIPLLTNEELILLRAEAHLGLGNLAAAVADINLIRVHAGGLAPIGVGSPDAVLDELLYNRLMSLMFTQGVRWVDARKYDRLDELPIDRPGDVVHPYMLVPVAECDARGLTVPCEP